MSLRNELRSPDDNAIAKATYNWSTWYNNVVAASSAIHSANSDPLIFLSGLNYDTTLQPITAGTSLDNGKTFSLGDLSNRNKIVFELHNYDSSATSCSSLESGLYAAGYNAMDTSSSTTAKNIAPVVMTEFGFLQNSTYLARCLRELSSRVSHGVEWRMDDLRHGW